MPDASEKEQPRLPLSGIRILDAASFIAAPVAATVLGDYGADVIKVEPPGEGDPNRAIMMLSAGYPKSHVNYPWRLNSRGKRSLAIDLKNPLAREAFDRVLAAADVLIVNYPPAVRAKLRLTYEDVAKVNPRLIYASFTGYGETGPDADQVGFDANGSSRSGIFDGARYDGGVPAVSMPAQGDRAAGMALAIGIMVALWNRERTGLGTKVSSSLLANGISANANVVQAAMLGAELPKRPPPDRPRSALTNVYETRDGRWVQMTVVKEDRNWPELCRALGREELIGDPRFVETPKRRANSAELAAIMRAEFAARDIAQCRAMLKRAGVPFAEIKSAGEVARDEQAVAAGIYVATDNPEMPTTVAAPFSLDDVSLPPPKPGPALGAHSVDVLREAGVSSDDIAKLQASGGLG